VIWCVRVLVTLGIYICIFTSFRIIVSVMHSHQRSNKGFKQTNLSAWTFGAVVGWSRYASKMVYTSPLCLAADGPIASVHTLLHVQTWPGHPSVQSSWVNWLDSPICDYNIMTILYYYHNVICAMFIGVINLYRNQNVETAPDRPMLDPYAARSVHMGYPRLYTIAVSMVSWDHCLCSCL